jgi:Holliday junction resolvasome RuvABC ATP-dependent DNA helicase subunit
MEDLFGQIARVLETEGVPLVQMSDNYYLLPPCIIFIDEVHALNDSIVQGLLKATEYSDSILAIDNGRIVNTYNVMWVIATTDSGKLFDAFRTRFAIIELHSLNRDELVQVVLKNHPDWPEEAGRLVAHYVPRNTRKALEFARYMRLVKNMGSKSWEEAAHEVAKQYGIDEFGMHRNELLILKALAQGPVAQGRIVYTVPGKKREEMENFILPPLMANGIDHPALIRVSGKGYTLTDAGKKELEKRGISFAA